MADGGDELNINAARMVYKLSRFRHKPSHKAVCEDPAGPQRNTASFPFDKSKTPPDNYSLCGAFGGSKLRAQTKTASYVNDHNDYI